MPRRRAQAAESNAVVNLSEVRARKKLAEYRERIGNVLDANRRAIGRLYTTGALFTRQGARAGRDLLLAHQHLLRVMSLIARLSSDSSEGAKGTANAIRGLPGLRTQAQVNAVYSELDELLDRTSELTTRTGTYLARLRNE